MNKREAKILALEVFASSADILIELDTVSDAIYTTKDCDLVNEAFYELADSLRRRANKLKSRNNL